MTTKAYCADCGWMKPVERSFVKDRVEVNLCAACHLAREKKAGTETLDAIDRAENKGYFVAEKLTPKQMFYTGVLLGLQGGMGIGMVVSLLLFWF